MTLRAPERRAISIFNYWLKHFSEISLLGFSNIKNEIFAINKESRVEINI
jgi:hypothetical protein